MCNAATATVLSQCVIVVYVCVTVCNVASSKSHHYALYKFYSVQCCCYFVTVIVCKCGIHMYLLLYHTAQCKLYTHVQVHLCACMFNTCITSKLLCALTVARNFDMRMWESKHKQHMIDVCHELTLSLSHYMCGVTTGTVAIGNKIQLFAADWLLYML